MIFRCYLLKIYEGKCIITNNSCEDELSACHIIPVSHEGDYSNNNGLLMTHNLHSTFDKFMWSINPDTMMIEIDSSKNAHTIKNYQDIKININMNPFLYINLKWHYNQYQSKCL